MNAPYLFIASLKNLGKYNIVCQLCHSNLCNFPSQNSNRHHTGGVKIGSHGIDSGSQT